MCKEPATFPAFPIVALVRYKSVAFWCFCSSRCFLLISHGIRTMNECDLSYFCLELIWRFFLFLFHSPLIESVIDWLDSLEATLVLTLQLVLLLRKLAQGGRIAQWLVNLFLDRAVPGFIPSIPKLLMLLRGMWTVTWNFLSSPSSTSQKFNLDA